MLLKVRLPTSIPQIPKMSMPPLPLSMSDMDLTLSSLPSSSTILLSLVAIFVLTSFVRALWIGLREHMALVKEKRQQQHRPVPAQSLVSPSEKSGIPEEDLRRPTPSWLWSFVRWDSLFALRAPSTDSTDSSFTNEKQRWCPQPQFNRRTPMMSQVARRAGPAFDRPREFLPLPSSSCILTLIPSPQVPTLYESDIPVSMAKMIMSRHVGDI